jgi:hypothetical protein
MYEEDSPVINLSKPLIITKNSNPKLLSTFLKQRIRLACDYNYLDEDNLNMSMDSKDGASVLVKYKEINLF